jgi:DNA gyrase inhibitor
MRLDIRRNGYRERLERVLAHIRANLDRPLDLDELADIACLSRFHWHRVYRGLMGETVWQTVKRLRLHRAAAELASGPEPVAQIAVRCGYGNVRAFSKAFRDEYGLPPSRYRAEGGHRRYDEPGKESHAMYDIRIEEFPGATLAGVPHRGSYLEIGAAFEKLGMELGRCGAEVEPGRLAAAYFDDPDITPVAELRSLAGVLVGADEAVPEELERQAVPAGRYAVLSHRGPYAELHKAYSFLFGKWLPQSGEAPRAVPTLECYLNTPRDVAPQDLLTELWLALENPA